MPPLSLYFHIPFCTHRCAYCDFNTYAGQEEMIPAYVDALCKEVEFVGSRLESKGVMGERKVHTLFFGGGTPSLLSPKHFELIFQSIHDNFNLTEEVEVTMEANPGTVSYNNLLDLHQVGINRLSYGVQSANPNELRMLERVHSFFDVIEAVTAARKAGFDNINLDLIYGLPEQTLASWQTTVGRILDLRPEHISAYALTLEHGTPFGRWSSKGLLPIPDPDLAAEMYEWLGGTLESKEYIQYEISNWAKDVKPATFDHQHPALRPYPLAPKFACCHNLQYWRGLSYLAFGAGAHGYANGYRYSNVLRIKTYIERLSNIDDRISNTNFPLSPAAVNHHKQSLEDEMSEFMMTGLRLTQEGVCDDEFQARFGRSMYEVYGEEIDGLSQLGLVEELVSEDNRPLFLRITKRGRLLGNQVFMRFV